jgi:hypothetical protein
MINTPITKVLILRHESIAVWVIGYSVIGDYLELACLPVGREFGYWNLVRCTVCQERTLLGKHYSEREGYEKTHSLRQKGPGEDGGCEQEGRNVERSCGSWIHLHES